MNTETERGQLLYTACAGFGILVFFLGPMLALLSDIDPLLAASIGYSGIALFTGGIAARYSFAVATHPLVQLLKNLAVALAVTGVFYVIFLLLYLI
ncbi:MAG: hypothetical protein IH600_06570 [Bacteroidetes bacterium]|nr:hypothetical protein [Bacteroidota bacterium]